MPTGKGQQSGKKESTRATGRSIKERPHRHDEYERIKAQLDAYIPPKTPAIEDLPGYTERHAHV